MKRYMKYMHVLVLISMMVVATGCATAGAAGTPGMGEPVDWQVESEAAAGAETPTNTATPEPTATATPTETPEADEDAEPVIKATSTPETFTPRAVILAGAVGLREGPGLGYSSTGESLLRGDEVELIGYYPETGWLQTEKGWITGSSEYLLVVGSVESLPVVVPDTAPQPLPTATPEPSLPGKLVFSTGSGGDIYVINADGTGLTHLSHGMEPYISPDGTQVVFTRWDQGEEGLWLVNTDGTGEQPLFAVTMARWPSWSADGKSIVFSRQAGGELYNYRKCVSMRQARDYNRGRVLEMETSREPMSACMLLLADPHWRLGRYILDTGYFEDLPSDNYTVSPTSNPADPNLVYYRGHYGENVGIVGFDLSAMSNWKQVADVNDHTPIMSPDGTRFASAYHQHDHWEIHTFNVDGSGRTRLTESPFLSDTTQNSTSPTWSPDGKYIAFLTDRTGKWEIWVMNADGTDERPMFPDGTLDGIDFVYDSMEERLLSWGL